MVFEVTSDCNNDCMYCYNVWKSPNNTYQKGQIQLSDVIKIIDKREKYASDLFNKNLKLLQIVRSQLRTITWILILTKDRT